MRKIILVLLSAIINMGCMKDLPRINPLDPLNTTNTNTGTGTTNTTTITKQTNYTKLLLHMDGVDGSTTITDSSGNGHNGTCIGSACLKTSQLVFGMASAYAAPAANYYISIPDSTDWDFGSGPFTIDCWFQVPDLVSDHFIFAGYSEIWLSIFTANNKMNYCASSNGSTWIFADVPGSHTLTANMWTHMAFVRNGNSWKAFINGELDMIQTSSLALAKKSEIKVIGGFRNATLFPLMGYIDEFRISSIARWTSDFTPPTSPYIPD